MAPACFGSVPFAWRRASLRSAADPVAVSGQSVGECSAQPGWGVGQPAGRGSGAGGRDVGPGPASFERCVPGSLSLCVLFPAHGLQPLGNALLLLRRGHLCRPRLVCVDRLVEMARVGNTRRGRVWAFCRRRPRGPSGSARSRRRARMSPAFSPIPRPSSGRLRIPRAARRQRGQNPGAQAASPVSSAGRSGCSFRWWAHSRSCAPGWRPILWTTSPSATPSSSFVQRSPDCGSRDARPPG